MKKDKIKTGVKHIGQFHRGGKNKYLPVWLERKAVTPPQPQQTIVKRTYVIHYDLWNILKWALIAAAFYLIWENTTITFTYQ